jgi:AraC family transcriptional regulator
MTITARLLASGPGWRFSDFLCTAGPQDRAEEEQHESISIAAVTEGSFQYRSSDGTALLAPGALLLGNPGSCFRCGHEHAVGDRCLALHVTPEWMESVLAAVPGARRLRFGAPRIPPRAALVPLLAALEAARDRADAAELEELALRLAGAVAAMLAGGRRLPRLTAQDERRITAALRRIEAAAEEPLSLAALAREAATSPYHFLRSFQRVVGMTPHQYLLRTRLHRAALRLRRTRDPVSAIAYDAGFNDLSTFNHRFRAVMGAPPSAWRAAGPQAPQAARRS